MDRTIPRIVDQILDSGAIGRADARAVLDLPPECLPELLAGASRVRARYRQNRVMTCAIVNAKSGNCSEDCAFCAQSARYTTDTPSHPLLSPPEILERARAEEGHSRRFSIVTSGRSLSDGDLDAVAQAIVLMRTEGITQRPCASLGILDEAALRALRQAGLQRYHHNLEAARAYYPNVCTSHSYEERLATIRAAQRAGLEVCCGGIFGIGESPEDRLDLLFELRDLAPAAVPLNFLVPIPGTPLEHAPLIPLWEAVKVIALARFVMPATDIKIAAGRLDIFRDAQDLVFLAGANGMIVGNLLTVKGRTIADDLRLLRELGLQISA